MYRIIRQSEHISEYSSQVSHRSGDVLFACANVAVDGHGSVVRIA
jgi:hypothetical protein